MPVHLHRGDGKPACGARLGLMYDLYDAPQFIRVAPEKRCHDCEEAAERARRAAYDDANQRHPLKITIGPTDDIFWLGQLRNDEELAREITASLTVGQRASTYSIVRATISACRAEHPDLVARRWAGTLEGAEPPVEIHAYLVMVSPQTGDPAVLAMFDRDLRERPVEILEALDAVR